MAQSIPPNFEKLLAMLKGSSAGSGMRDVKPEERASFGINPKDPNQFSVSPDGRLTSTLIGWSEKPQDLSKVIGGIAGTPQPLASSRPDNMIPRVNKNGLQRMSPGVYRNKDGGLVRKVKG